MFYFQPSLFRQLNIHRLFVFQPVVYFLDQDLFGKG